MSTEPIHDRVVVVTGAAGGFGRLVSQKCAALGARLMCADIHEEQLAATVESIRAMPGAGQLPQTELDRDSIGYFALDPESLAEQIVYAINQPWGVSIAEITVRASG